MASTHIAAFLIPEGKRFFFLCLSSSSDETCGMLTSLRPLFLYQNLLNVSNGLKKMIFFFEEKWHNCVVFLFKNRLKRKGLVCYSVFLAV